MVDYQSSFLYFLMQPASKNLLKNLPKNWGKRILVKNFGFFFLSKLLDLFFVRNFGFFLSNCQIAKTFFEDIHPYKM